MCPFIRQGRFLLPLLLAASAAAAGASSRNEASSPGKTAAVLYDLEGQLRQTMTVTLKRAVKQARASGAGTLIVEIDTPGGEMMLMEQLRDILLDAASKGLETVAYVNPNADSAGALVTLACRRIYMAPVAHMGSATPVIINPGAPLAPFLPGGQEDMNRKIKARARAVFRATAAEHGRNPEIAEAMVDPDVELLLVRVEGEERVMSRRRFTDAQARLGKAKAAEISVLCPKGELLNMTAREALDWGFIDGIAENREALCRDFLGIDPGAVELVRRSWSEGLVDAIESIHFLLLIAGLILLYIEFQIPGFGIPGILGLACLALLMFNKWLAGLAEATDLLLILAGAGLIAVEIFLIPGTLVAGITGALMMLAGLILSFQPFILPENPWETELLMDNVVYLSGSLLIVVAAGMLFTRSLPRLPVLRRLVLDTRTPPGGLHATAGAIDDVRPGLRLAPGMRGTAYSRLRPAGKAEFGEGPIDVQSEGAFIEAGEPVEVVRVIGNFVVVRKCEDERH